jgi:hypothetical protein
MSETSVTREHQQCISQCIVDHWGENSQFSSESDRDSRYEQCLTECRVCA